jgi:hypothetical protein
MGFHLSMMDRYALVRNAWLDENVMRSVDPVKTVTLGFQHLPRLGKPRFASHDISIP